MGEHSHIPTSRRTPYPGGATLPEYYKHFPDPFVELTAAAAVTQKLKVGTAVCLLSEHHPITLAKTVATIDRVSAGRFLLGVGGGWNVEEMANHGIEFKDRWNVTREFVRALRAIWGGAEAEFHGQFVDFDPIWSWPKPVQASGPPVLLGCGATPAMPKRALEYCNGWMPLDGIYDVAEGIASIRAEAARAGRSLDDFDLSVLTGFGGFEATGAETRVRELSRLGFQRILLVLEPGSPETQWLLLDHFERLLKRFQ